MPLNNSLSFTFGLDYFLNDFPTDHQTLQHGEDLVVTGEGRQVVDVHMDVDEAALHLHQTVVSLLCILLAIEEEEASCLVGVDDVDVQNHDGEVGET